MEFAEIWNLGGIYSLYTYIYTQQKKKVNTFSSSDFSYKTFINIHELYIKLTEI